MNAEFRDISKEAFIIAYKENYGNITIACHASGVGRGMYKSWCENDKEFRTRLAEIEPEEIMLDFGEHKLMERIAKGDTLATMFLLKTKGKRRGYIEKQEIAHEGDVVKQITVNVIRPGGLLSDIPKLDGDEHKSLPEPEDDGIINFDTQVHPGLIIPASEADRILEIPLYEHDEEVDYDKNEDDEYEE